MMTIRKMDFLSRDIFKIILVFHIRSLGKIMFPIIVLCISTACLFYALFVVFTQKSHFLWKISAAILFLGEALIVIKAMIPTYLDKQDRLHEPFFIFFPIGFMMMFLGIILVCLLAIVSNFHARKR